ncbi:MAG TPA: response regulator [Gemmatimonadales bacterium]|nr:response regulator [Gemmatimonadales bacterium]
MKILVVEDDRKVAGFLQEGLREEGFDVEAAHEGNAAFQRAASGQFDLVILDYMLPNRSGPDIAAGLRQAGVTTRILMLTARDDPRDVKVARAAGVDAYLTKPFRFDDLLDRVKALLPSA